MYLTNQTPVRLTIINLKFLYYEQLRIQSLAKKGRSDKQFEPGDPEGFSCGIHVACRVFEVDLPARRRRHHCFDAIGDGEGHL